MSVGAHNVRTTHTLHDSIIEGLEWVDQELRLTVRLDGHWNAGFCGSVRLVFVSVRNRADVEAWWANRPERPRDIVALVREPDGAFCLDATPGPPLRVVCSRVFDV